MKPRWRSSFLRLCLLFAGFVGGLGGTGQVNAQGLPAPAFAANFAWSVDAGAVVQANTNTVITCTVDVYLTGDPYQPLPPAVGCVPSIVGAGGSVTVITNVDYSPWWAQYVCVFTPSDPGYLTLKVDVGTIPANRAVTAVRLKEIVFSPDQVIAVSNAVTMTAVVEPAGFAATFAWDGAIQTNGPTATVTLNYGGHIPAWVILLETGEALGTEVVVISPTLTVFASDDPGAVNEATGIGVLVENDEGLPHSVTWSGVVTGTGDTVTYTPTTPGTKSATATVTVGPWTGSVDVSQDIYSFDVTAEGDSENNIIYTYSVDGPPGRSFTGIAGFLGEFFEFEIAIPVGTTVLTIPVPDYHTDEFQDITPDPDGGNTCFPSPPIPQAPGKIEGKIRIPKITKIITTGAGLVFKEIAEAAIEYIVKQIGHDVTSLSVTVPPVTPIPNQRLKAYYYKVGEAAPYDAISDPFTATVRTSGSTLTADWVPRWQQLQIRGQLKCEINATPHQSYVRWTDTAATPNVTYTSPAMGKLAVTASIDDSLGSNYFGQTRKTDGCAQAWRSIKIGGEGLPRTYSYSGLLEFVEGTAFDNNLPPTPHRWIAMQTDTLKLPSVDVVLNTVSPP